MKKIILILLLIIILTASCTKDIEVDENEADYGKCTSVCSSVLGDDFTTMELCRKECKAKFLERS